MTWLESGHPAAALGCLLACGLLGWFAPRVIARLPEPESEAAVLPAALPAGAPVKESYIELSGLTGLAWKCALASAVVGGVVGASVGWDWRLGALVWLAPVGVMLALIDWRTTLLPTRLIAPSYAAVVALVLLAAWLEHDWDIALRAGIGWASAGGVFVLLWLIYPKGMGYGDVRLSGVLGLALGQLGYAELVVGIYGAFLIGGFGGLLLSAMKVVDRKRFPFGPFMLIAAVLGVIFGPGIAAGLGY